MKYSLNQNYFEKIDSEDKAYFLGFMYADGYNQENRSKYISISIQERDREILDNFQYYLDSNYPIKIYERNKINPNFSDICSLQVNGKKISEDLRDKGCIQAKSKVLLFPTEEQLPKHLYRHFIRGVFDGDGSVWEGKRKLMDIKDLTRKEGHRIKIIHNVKFNITGTESMMLGIQKILVGELLFKMNKLNRSKNIENCVQLEYSGRLQMKKFYDFLYSDSNVYLKRKKKKFEEILNLC